MLRDFLLNNSQLAAFLVSLLSVGLAGFQHKNVAGNHYKSVFITSCVKAVTDVAAIGLIAANGFDIVPFIALGGALGTVGAMKIHAITVGKIG
jgi:hypothetical protein